MRTLRAEAVSVPASLCSALAIAIVGLALASDARAATLSLLPSTQDAAPGGTVEVDLAISGLDDLSAPSLGVYDVVVTYDASVLSFSDARFGDPLLGNQLDLAGFGTVSGVVPGSGSVELFEISLDLASDLDTLQPGSFRLARLDFEAIALGTSDLGLQLLAVGDAVGAPLDTQATGGSVSVVPEPAAAPLFVVGVLAVAPSMRRRRTGAGPGASPAA